MAKRSVKTKVALKVTNGVLHILLNVLFYCIVAVVIIKACTITYDFSYQLFGDVAVSEAPGIERQIVVDQHESTMSVASKLELYKLIVNKYSFYVRAKLTNEVIKPGTYIINSAMSYDEIFDVITGETEEDSESST